MFISIFVEIGINSIDASENQTTKELPDHEAWQDVILSELKSGLECCDNSAVSWQNDNVFLLLIKWMSE